jgi:hypothetical protein
LAAGTTKVAIKTINRSGYGTNNLPTTTSKLLTYQGKTIEYWFAQLPLNPMPLTPMPPPGVEFSPNSQVFVTSYGQQYGSTNVDGIAAIEALGTNALPFLLAKLQGLDSFAKKVVTKAATNTSLGYLPFRKADLERSQAVTGLIYVRILTPEAKQLITSLRTNNLTSPRRQPIF